MPRILVAEIMDLTIRQGFDVEFARNEGEYFIITLYKEDCCRKLMIDIDDLRSEAFYSIEDYIVNILEKARDEIITEEERRMTEYICQEVRTDNGGYLEPVKELIRCKNCQFRDSELACTQFDAFTSAAGDPFTPPDWFYCGYGKEKEQ